MEERQQGEGESASETSEHVGGVCVRGLLLSSTHFNEEEESEEEDGGGAEEKFIYRPEGQSEPQRPAETRAWSQA